MDGVGRSIGRYVLHASRFGRLPRCSTYTGEMPNLPATRGGHFYATVGFRAGGTPLIISVLGSNLESIPLAQRRTPQSTFKNSERRMPFELNFGEHAGNSNSARLIKFDSKQSTLALQVFSNSPYK